MQFEWNRIHSLFGDICRHLVFIGVSFVKLNRSMLNIFPPEDVSPLDMIWKLASRNLTPEGIEERKKLLSWMLLFLGSVAAGFTIGIANRFLLSLP